MTYKDMNHKVYLNDNAANCDYCKRATTCTNKTNKKTLEEKLKKLASDYSGLSTTGLIVQLGCYAFDPDLRCKCMNKPIERS